MVKKVFKANKSLTAQHSIDTHTIARLQAALANKKKKRKREKKLNLLGKEDKGNLKFYSPNKVERAREYNMAKEATKTQKQLNIAKRKATAAANKAKKEEEKVQRATTAQLQQEQADAKKAARAKEIEAKEKARELAKLQKEQNTKTASSRKRSNKASKQPVEPEIVYANTTAVAEVEEVIQINSRGRRVQLPNRYID